MLSALLGFEAISLLIAMGLLIIVTDVSLLNEIETILKKDN